MADFWDTTYSSRSTFFQRKAEAKKEKVKLSGWGCNLISVRPTRQTEGQRAQRRSPVRLLKSMTVQLVLQRRALLSCLTLELIICCVLLPDILRWPPGETAGARKEPINYSDTISTLMP